MAPEKTRGLVIDWRDAILSPACTLSASARLVAVALAKHMNAATGRCWPSSRLLARETGLARSTVVEALHVLDESGWISGSPRQVEDQTPENPGGAKHPNEYRARFPQTVRQSDTQTVRLSDTSKLDESPERSDNGLKRSDTQTKRSDHRSKRSGSRTRNRKEVGQEVEVEVGRSASALKPSARAPAPLTPAQGKTGGHGFSFDQGASCGCTPPYALKPDGRCSHCGRTRKPRR